VILWEARAGAGSCKDLQANGQRSLRHSMFDGRACEPRRKGLTLGQFMNNSSPQKGLMLEKFVEHCLPWVGPHAGVGEEYEEECSQRQVMN